MKKLFILFILCISSSIYSREVIEIKLECQANYQVNIDNEPYKNISGKEYITIVEVDNLREILLYGIYKTGVRNFKNEYEYNIYDASNSNKWVIHNKMIIKGIDFDTRVVIDRNTGLLDVTVFSVNEKNMKFFERLTGTCSKVDTSQKKF